DLVDFEEKYGRHILKGFDYYYKKGKIEFVGAAATHAYLPLYQQYPVNINAQLQVAIDYQESVFGKHPTGFWLPECGYYPGLEEHLRNNGMRYFFSAAHSILFAEKRPPAGVYEPVMSPNGLAVFGRDIASANMVWSSDEGYPGDFTYRDFYRDIGYDLPLDYIGPYIHDGSIRINTGIKYYAITGNTEQKRPYDPVVAAAKAKEHAENFIYNQTKQVAKLGPLMSQPPVITCPYDAELFGHWWFEGTIWIEEVIRKLAETGGDLELTTPSSFLKAYPPTTVIEPIFSSWGNNGYSEVWLDGSNDWIYRHTHTAIERMMELVERFPDDHGLKERALNQAAREVLLSQASDWPFIMRAGTTVSYATKRVKEHIMNFQRIYESLGRGNVGTEWLTKLEKKDNLFPKIDYRIFRAQGARTGSSLREIANH
ncbi:MAG TPA: 1,4-alpha-glucan branching protein domain-containing protein, partial [Spirochaetia bacterium]|nr:1,4-alpha-glucan branching protein domain-containing protein [Spirochaetia bacterium]